MTFFFLPGVVDFRACIHTKTDSRQATPTLDIELVGLEPLTQNLHVDPGLLPGLKTAIEAGRLWSISTQAWAHNESRKICAGYTDFLTK